jgi:acyl-coenzyme A thioesterase PaaI-like protein
MNMTELAEPDSDLLLAALGVTQLDEPDGDILGYLDPTAVAQGSSEQSFVHGGALGTCVEIFGYRAVELAARRKGFHGAEWWPVSFQVELLRVATAQRYAIRGTAERIGKRHAFARVEIAPVDGAAAVTTGTVLLINAAAS